MTNTSNSLFASSSHDDLPLCHVPRDPWGYFGVSHAITHVKVGTISKFAFQVGFEIYLAEKYTRRICTESEESGVGSPYEIRLSTFCGDKGKTG